MSCSCIFLPSISQPKMESSPPTPLSPDTFIDCDDYQPKPLLDQHKPSKERTQKTTIKHLQTYIQTFHHLHTDIGINENSDADKLSFEMMSDDNFVGCYLDWLSQKATFFHSTQALSYKPVLGYASSFAKYYLNKFRTIGKPRTLEKNLGKTTRTNYICKSHVLFSKQCKNVWRKAHCNHWRPNEFVLYLYLGTFSKECRNECISQYRCLCCWAL